MSDSNRVRVVAVEDEPVTLALIKQALSNHPQIDLVGTGVNGREALQLANRLRPDVIVLDRAAAQEAMSRAEPLMIATPDAPLARFTRSLVEEALNLPPTRGDKRGTRWRSMFDNFKKLLGR